MVLFFGCHLDSSFPSLTFGHNLFRKDLSTVFLAGQKLVGKTYCLWYGLCAQNTLSRKIRAWNELYAGSKPHQYVGYYVDAFGEQKPFRFCGEKGVGKNTALRLFL